jgi:serine carboxypeptidase-like clade II
MGDEDTQFKRNLYAWNKEANVVYIEMPAGVGYSTCNEMEDGGLCYKKVTNTTYELNDELVANETFIALRNLLKMKFPEFSKNDLYLSGESYAGIYVPYLALKIDQYNEKETQNQINLKGIIVGNGCTDFSKDCLPSSIDMVYQHHILSDEMYSAYTEKC